MAVSFSGRRVWRLGDDRVPIVRPNNVLVRALPSTPRLQMARRATVDGLHAHLADLGCRLEGCHREPFVLSGGIALTESKVGAVAL